jgi:diguanylate cyclase (GGDEF)-like protein/PAS domain S-box-containing protein
MKQNRRVDRRSVLGISLFLFASITAFRFSTRDPSEPIMYLLVIPVGLLAAEFRLKGGLLAAGFASGLVVLWDILASPELSSLGFSLRFIVYFASGITIGILAQTSEELRGESQRWFDQSTDLNCVADINGNFIRVNPAFQKLLGFKTRDVVGTPYISYVHPDDVDRTILLTVELAEGKTAVGDFENRYRTADGSYRWLRWASTTDHERGLVYASARDVTKTKELEEELKSLAETDGLTGLLNRRAFENEATRQIDFLRRYGPGGALFLFDIDRFKEINDTLGHQAGDEALRTVARVVLDSTRATDTRARLGGDEFVILFPGIGPNEADILATGLLASVRHRPNGDLALDAMTASLGIALFDQSTGETLDELLARADAAMYRAKRAGGDCFVSLAGDDSHLEVDLARHRSADAI